MVDERALSTVESTYLAELSNFDEQQKNVIQTASMELPPAGYAIPMMVHILEQFANDTVDRTLPWGFADFSVQFRLLAEGLCDLAESAGSSDHPIYVADVLDFDPNVERYLLARYGRVAVINERVGIMKGMLSVIHDGQQYRVSIADSRRRSALTLLRIKAQYLQYSEEERTELHKATASSMDELDISRVARLTLMMNMREIDVLRIGLPKTWTRLLSILALEEEALLTFLAFATSVPALGYDWLEYDQAFDVLNELAAQLTRPEISRTQFEKLMELFASDPETARRIGTATTFLRIGTRLLAWPFAHHALLPELVFVTLVQGKRSDAWSTTFGSDLAEAADYLAAQLKSFPQIKVVARRKKVGVGDVDLCIYDKSSGDLLICEIKTVFDRFRTEFQSSNFVEDRVNFSKAVGQLNTARDALLNGRWALSDVLGIPRMPPPTRVHRMVLLWRDHINPTLDDGEFVPVCDFATFQYLFERCHGKPSLIAESVEQLEKIFWVSKYHADFWPIGERQVSFERELETNALPPMSFFDTLTLNEVVRGELSSLAKFPEDWNSREKDSSGEWTPVFRTALS